MTIKILNKLNSYQYCEHKLGSVTVTVRQKTVLLSSVAEPHHIDAALAPSKNSDAASAPGYPATTLLPGPSPTF
jgi:hypothetical protein